MKLRRLLLAGFSLLSTALFSQDFNYGEALQKSILFYEAQQSGVLPEWNRVSWRGDSAVNDGSDVGHDLTGGWYDAGDNVKFNFPMAYSVTILAWAAIEYPEAYKNSGQLEILKRNLKYVTDYFIKCHTGPTELYGQVGNGTADHAWWGSPELVELIMERPSYKIDAENPGSDLAAETAAAMAATSMLFADTDPAYSAELLEHAIELYDFADNYRGVYSDAIVDAQDFYRSWSGYNDEIVWGAIWLYRATGNNDYLDKAKSEYDNLGTEIGSDVKSYKWGLAWDDKGYGCYVLMSMITGESQYKADVERHLDYWTVGYEGDKITYSEGGQAHLTVWGSLRHSANTSLLALIYSDKVIPNTDKADIYHDFAVNQIDYALGENPLNRSYMVGYGNDPAHSVHHRAAHGSWADSWQEPVETSHVIYGALAGGPEKPDDFFEDDRNNYYANEVACDYNAGLTGVLARLYSQYGGDPLSNFPQEEMPTRSELRSYSKFNSNTEFGSTVSIMFQNRTAWPARVADNVTMRYFFDISEAVADGYSISDIGVSLSYAQSDISSLTIKEWDAENNVYYAEISLVGNEIAPVGDPEFRYEVQIQITANNIPYDISNDWSASGLTGVATESVNIPVYDNGILVFGQEPPGGNTPRASFTATPETGFAPLVVEFDSSESSDPNGDNITYAWVFGNGETSSLANPTITFDEIGSFEVSLTVSDGVNTSYAFTKTITTEDPNVAPVAVIGASTIGGIAPQSITFDASDSSDANGDDLTYAWDFGDGASSTLESPSHTYTEIGEYKVKLTVSDGAKSGSDTITITITDGTPVISYSYTVNSTEAPFEVDFDASNSVDPEQGALTYSWDFGNGTSASTAVASTTYTEDGDYTVSLTITNESGKQDTEEFVVSVGNSNCIFDTPRATALPNVDNVAYENIFVLGEDGPNMENVTGFTLNWNLNNNGLYQFAFNLSVSPNYIDFSTSTQNFDSSQPEITLSGTGIPGLDGSYYVTVDEGNFVMVSKTEGFTLYYSKTADEPACSNDTNIDLSNPVLDITNYDVKVYPNPASEVLNLLVNTSETLKASEKEVLLINLLGQTVLSGTISEGETTLSFDINGLAAGNYFMQINIEGEVLVVKKLIIN